MENPQPTVVALTVKRPMFFSISIGMLQHKLNARWKRHVAAQQAAEAESGVRAVPPQSKIPQVANFFGHVKP
jgi:hypothetical protein